MNRAFVQSTILATALTLAWLMGASAEDAPKNAGPDPVVPTPLRWTLNGSNGIAWNVAEDQRLPHSDRIETTGFQAAATIRYGADRQGNLQLQMNAAWPNLHTVPGKTNGYVFRRFRLGDYPRLTVAGRPVGAERLTQVVIDGVLTLQSCTPEGLLIRRAIFPSREIGAIVTNYTVTNSDSKPVTLGIAPSSGSEERVNTIGIKPPLGALAPLTATPTGFTEDVDTKAAGYGVHRVASWVDAPCERTLAPGASCRFTAAFTARRSTEPELQIDGAREEAARRSFVKDLGANLVMETPDPVLDRMFQLGKIRTAEAIFKTKGGLMHSPGGDRYNGGVWCNDQGESSAAFFPFLGYGIGNDTFLNIFRLYAKYTNPDYRHLAFSIVHGGDSAVGNADRGDMAMLAYGASWFALARGDRAIAEELFPFILWNLEYCQRHLNQAGVVASELDEFERRLASGTNLHTSVLTYEALRLTAILARSLGHPETEAAGYEQRAAILRKAMDAYFAANIDGFDTYRYCDNTPNLRAFICSPFFAGITERKQGTIAALLSPQLWTPRGLIASGGCTDPKSKGFDVWDKSTLYALRGFFVVDEPDLAMSRLRPYCESRLLGEHVPYAIEALLENDKEHLSGECTLFLRIFTEGLFGIRPAGLHSFTCKPSLPTAWNEMALRKIHAFGGTYDIEVKREGKELAVTATTSTGRIVKRIAPGGTVQIDLPPANNPSK